MQQEYLGPSKCIQAAGWEAGNLDITFTDGSRYIYHGVSPKVWYNLKLAGSKGKFFNLYIRDNYSFDEA